MDEKEVSEMQEEMMTVLVVEPMKAPYVKSIPNELENLQQAVGGDIEMTYPFEDEVGILLNGNGKFEGLPLNRALYDDHGQIYDAIDLERGSIAVNKAVAAFRQDHGRGIMIHVTSQRAEDGLRVVIRKTLRTSVRGGRPAARL